MKAEIASPSAHEDWGMCQIGRLGRYLHRNAFAYLSVLPALAILILVFGYPLYMALRLSFFRWELGSTYEMAKWVGLDNYINMLRDPTFLLSVRTTLIFVLGGVCVQTLVGLGLALLLQKPLRGVRILRSLTVLPLMMTPVVVGLMWRLLYSPQFGMVNYFLGKLGIAPQAWLADKFLALPAIMFVDFWQWMPFMFLMLLSGLMVQPEDSKEAAVVDGASSWQIFWYITLPLLLPTAGVAILIRTMDGFRSLDTIFVLTYGGPARVTEVMSFYLYRVAFVDGQLGSASALSYMLLAIIAVLSFGLSRILERPVEL